MVNYVISRNGTYHISLYNVKNSFCYFISVLQRLHSSPTLNNHAINLWLNVDFDTISQIENSNDIFAVLMFPICVYAQLKHDDREHRAFTYQLLYEYLEMLANKYVSNVANDGYFPEHLMVYFMLPVVYKYFPDDFVNILNELHIDEIEFSRADYVCRDVINNDRNTFLKNEQHRNEICNTYNTMISYVPKFIELNPFCCGTLELFPNKNKTTDHTYGGHAITIIYGSSDDNENEQQFYIIDDSNSIVPLTEYYLHRNERIHELCLRNVSKETINKINNVFRGECKADDIFLFENRASRFTINFEHSFNKNDPNYELKEEKQFDKVKPEFKPAQHQLPTTPTYVSNIRNKVQQMNNKSTQTSMLNVLSSFAVFKTLAIIALFALILALVVHYVKTHDMLNLLLPINNTTNGNN